MSALRPLPSRPSLEFDRKEAKALLRRLRTGDQDALLRAQAQHSTIDVSVPARIALADAQLVIAREYGFTSWPRLVQYYGGIVREPDRIFALQSPDSYENSVRWLLAEHREKLALAGRRLAAYVPRFYGLSGKEVLALAITEDEARLAVARSEGFPSWEVLIERAAIEKRKTRNEWDVTPRQRAVRAMESANLHELQNIVAAHPDELLPSGYHKHTLIGAALECEQVNGCDRMRPIMEWLTAKGQDLQHELNTSLCGAVRTKTKDVLYWLERGANANWIAPNGFSVLEHALLRYRNGEAVDLVAARATPRNAFWIAAGLGDVLGVSRFFDRHGRLTAAARLQRPPSDRLGPMRWPQVPEPDEEDLLMEAFLVAFQNGRAGVIEYLVSRGCDVNSLYWGTPFILIAVADGPKTLVECLLRCGANPDLWSPTNKTSARKFAREMFERHSVGKSDREILKLFGMDPDAIIAERDAKPAAVPSLAPKLQEALNLAADDALRLDQTDVRPENLLFGLFRFGELPLLFFTQVSKLDRERFHAAVLERVRYGKERVKLAELQLNVEAHAMLNDAIAVATERRSEQVNPLHLLRALLRDDHGIAAEMLVRFGGNLEFTKTELIRSM